jgi:hypothetical protein
VQFFLTCGNHPARNTILEIAHEYMARLSPFRVPHPCGFKGWVFLNDAPLPLRLGVILSVLREVRFSIARFSSDESLFQLCQEARRTGR